MIYSLKSLKIMTIIIDASVTTSNIRILQKKDSETFLIIFYFILFRYILFRSYLHVVESVMLTPRCDVQQYCYFSIMSSFVTLTFCLLSNQLQVLCCKWVNVHQLVCAYTYMYIIALRMVCNGEEPRIVRFTVTQ